jgi:hypothetical protein
MALSAAVALVSYALYTVNSEVLREGRQLASLPFVAYGIFSYLRLVGVDGAGESPVDIAYRSRSLQICALARVYKLGTANSPKLLQESKLRQSRCMP